MKLTIDGCEFTYNTSNMRAGAIFLYHGTEATIRDTSVKYNQSGLDHGTNAFNYAGGVNVYCGDA